MGVEDRLKQIQNANTGFGLVSAMMAMSMMGAAALMFGEMTGNMSKNQKNVQTAADFEEIRGNLKRVIDRQDLCAAAFFAADGVTRAKFNPSLSLSAAEVLSVVKVHGSIIAKKDQAIKGLRISRLDFTMEPSSVPDTATVPGRTIYEVMINLEAERVGAFVGTQQVSNQDREPHLSLVTVSATDEIESCASKDLAEMCGNLGGNWNPGRTPACETSNEFTVSNRSWTGYLNNFDQPVTRVPAPARFMTGYDTYHNNGAEDNRIRFQLGNLNDGDIPLVFGTGSCVNFTNVNNWDQPVNFRCPGNTYLVNETSFHNNGAEDRRYSYDCCTAAPSAGGTPVTKKNCEWSGLQNNFDFPVNFQCPDGKAMAGVRSIHDNGHEDRIYYFQCCGQGGL